MFDFSDAVSQAYVRQYLDTTSVFDDIIASGHKLRILVYNGDVDTACGFLAAEWFVEALKTKYGMNITIARQPWLYRQTSQTSLQLAGYQKSFAYQNITIDLVTVKVRE
jgi:cathepsin A (carboxypeptidase C)